MNKVDLKGKIIVIVAPSGTGKSSLIEKIKETFPQLGESVSFTTRAKRTNEIHGVHYFFISREDFESKISKDDFIEWALVHDDYKGTEKAYVEKLLRDGKVLLFDLDVQGADSMKRLYGKLSNIIFIEPPSFEELERRLRGRKTESEEKIQLRLSNARNELRRKNDYDFLVTNDNFDRAYNELKTIIQNIMIGK